MTGWDLHTRVISVEFLLIMHALPPRLPSRGERKAREGERNIERHKTTKERARNRERTRGIASGRETGNMGCRGMQGAGRTEIATEEDSQAGRRRYSLPCCSSAWFAFRSAHPRLPLCSPTVGRFTYKFNKHISYLMHALSRECFDRAGDHLPLLLLVFCSLLHPPPAFRPARATVGVLIAHLPSPSQPCTSRQWPRAGRAPAAAACDCI